MVCTDDGWVGVPFLLWHVWVLMHGAGLFFFIFVLVLAILSLTHSVGSVLRGLGGFQELIHLILEVCHWYALCNGEVSLGGDGAKFL